VAIHLHRAAAARVGQDDSEFFAAKARNNISRAGNYVLRRLSDLLEAMVAPQMPAGVVVSFEEVGVDQQQREWHAFAQFAPHDMGRAGEIGQLGRAAGVMLEEK
jgi:hypothetical protein